TGSGDDTIEVNGATVNGAASIKTSSGTDVVRLDDVTFNDPLHLNLGAGSDRLLIETLNTGAASTFAQKMWIALGAGDDLLDVGIDHDVNDFAVFNGMVRVSGGSGVDTVALGGPRGNLLAALVTTMAELVL